MNLDPQAVEAIAAHFDGAPSSDRRDRSALPLVAGERCGFCQSCAGWVGGRCSICGQPQRLEDPNDLHDDEADS